jgi:hypothetical protein
MYVHCVEAWYLLHHSEQCNYRLVFRRRIKMKVGTENWKEAVGIVTN